MRSKFINDERSLYDALSAAGVAKRRAMQLQNLMVHCKYSTFKIDCPVEQIEGCDMVIATINTPAEALQPMAEKAHSEHLTLCVISPTLDQQRDRACRAIVDTHTCTSVDNRGYLLLFNNHLPKQKFRL